ncbi:TetR/AcrR family transcriptional regulator [Chloroflexota bacterium]
MEEVLSRRERKKLETRERLLQSAVTLFREKGYTATAVEEITDEADVAKGTFFNYFPSKEALLGELVVWQVEQLRAELEASRETVPSPVGRIKLLVRKMHTQTIHDMRLVRRTFASRLSSPTPPPHRSRHRLFGLFTDLVSEAQACGEIRGDVEAELVSDLLHMSYFRRMVACYKGDGDPPPVDRFEQIIDLLLEGLAGPNWRQA